MLNSLLGSINNIVFAAAGHPCKLPGTDDNPFFGFPHWWEYLSGTKDQLDKCVPNFNFPSDILPVGLAIIDILLRFAGIAAVVSIIIAGFGYMAATGSPDKITASRKRIINSIVGLLIVIIAASVVSFIGNSIG